MKNYPIVTGNFIQPFVATKYDLSKWKEHFEHLLEVGIDTTILQWTADTPYGKFKDCCFETALSAFGAEEGYVCYSNCVKDMLEAAKQTGMKVFVGLNVSDEWWKFNRIETDWGEKQAAIGVGMAKELYEKYYAEYSDVFVGWYWAWELYNHMPLELADTGSWFMNLYIDGLNQIDPSLPIMYSPFLNQKASPEDTFRAWCRFFKISKLRKGDIFCCQDSIGAGFVDIENIRSLYKAVADAVKTKDGVEFWANNENFTPDFKAAPVSRFVEQMRLTDEYVVRHVTFSYSHYYHPFRSAAFHEQYKKYYETGSES